MVSVGLGADVDREEEEEVEDEDEERKLRTLRMPLPLDDACVGVGGGRAGGGRSDAWGRSYGSERTECGRPNPKPKSLPSASDPHHAKPTSACVRVAREQLREGPTATPPAQIGRAHV